MLNKVILMGRLVATPELKHTPTGLAVTGFTLAVNRDFVRQGGDRVTDFIDVVAWRSNAEFASKYFVKGQLVAVDGVLQTRTYQDKNGFNRKVFEVVADRLHFAESKRDSAHLADQGVVSNDRVRGDVRPGGQGADFADGKVDVPVEAETSFQTGSFDFTELPVDDDDLPF